MRNVFRKSSWILMSFAPWLAGCDSAPARGPVQVKTIQPTGQHCTYAIQPATLQTLDDVSQVRGRVGRVVMSGLDLASTSSTLDDTSAFRPIDAQFLKSGGIYSPVDFGTLFAVSLYYAIETGYLLHARLNPEADFVARIPGFADKTFIVHDAKRTFREMGTASVVKDNAEFLAHTSSVGGQRDTRNFFFSYPTDSASRELPLGLNLGIMVHEYTHLVFHNLFYEKGYARNIAVAPGTPTDNVLTGLDEGLADYFGYLATKDPGFFLCSFPAENRDVSIPKDYTAELDLALSDGQGYDPHELGAVFAAISYEIGNAMGNHEENARSLLKLMTSLVDCPAAQLAGAPGTLSLTFQAIAKCHAAAAGDSRASLIQQIYDSHTKVTGGGT